MHVRTIHLVNPLANFSGSERRALDYLALLSPHADVMLWAEGEPNVELASRVSRRIDRATGAFPQGGTLVLIGVYVERHHWLGDTKPERLIVVYNTPELHRLRLLLDFIDGAGLLRPELGFPSEAHRASAQMPGFVDWGLYDFELFQPSGRAPRPGRFTVGRMSRDEEYKHHPQDTRLYRLLAERGMRVRLMGATAVRQRMGDAPAIELLQTGDVEASRFLQSLDAFVYRTAPDWREPSGRVVVEAMACGLPVVVGRNGGYRELIEHGTNGFLFDTHVEAVEYLDALRADPALAQRIGRAARETVVGRFGALHIERVREFFLRPANQAEDAPRFDSSGARSTKAASVR